MPKAETDLNGQAAEEKMYVASQWQLIRWRFQKHRLAVLSTAILALFYLIALAPEFFATSDPEASRATHSLIPPQPVMWFENGVFSPHTFAVVGHRDLSTFKMVWNSDPDEKLPICFFAEGFEYNLFGFVPTNRHLIGLMNGAEENASVFLLGTDEQGRDLWSRIMYGTRVSMSIGLVGVFLSLFLGMLLGGISGFYGGWIDTIIQRIVEIIRSIPTIPLWMGLAAAVPRDWSVLRVYFAITIIISFLAWADLARVVRGKFLSLREEEFVGAAEVAGASQFRIIFIHMLPSFSSHIIAATTLAIPQMIISETALSFLGLGLRPPAVSWGVLLQQAQNVQTLALSPWLMIPALPVIIAIVSLNFIGDGLRDAADPYR